jgi:hypothetical protein
MMKPLLVLSAVPLLAAGSYYCSTEIGLRTTGWTDVVVDTTKVPSYAPVGQNVYSADGTKLLVTSISRVSGENGMKHEIHASVQGTHRYALQLFPTRMVHTFSMDRKAVDRAVLEAAGVPSGQYEASHQEWHVLQ